jgi:hypothetical protein
MSNYQDPHSRKALRVLFSAEMGKNTEESILF